MLADGGQRWRHADYRFGLAGAVMLVMAEDRFEVDFEADFSGAQLSAAVEGVVAGAARSSRLRVLPAVKTARWPPPGPAALPR